MHKLSLFISLLTSVIFSFAAVIPRSTQIEQFDGDVKEGSYIVKLNDNADKDGVLATIEDPTVVTHSWDPEFVNGFAGTFSDTDLQNLQSNPNVEYIAQDGIMKVSDVQTDAPWNLARVSTRDRLQNQNPQGLNYEYDYIGPEPGKDIDIYVVDTGIYTGHTDFGGRAKWGGTFCGGCQNADGNGHGTHVAGTAGGKRFGIAKSSNLIAVKVLNDNGSGSVSDVMNGLQWVQRQHDGNHRPSIATMSLGGSASTPLDDAVRALIRDGIHCTVAAGNSNVDAMNTSPARVTEAITVGATDINDNRAYYSNYGSVLDVFAPGSDVTSTWIDGGYQVLSGTSMATPNVAGVVAYFLNIYGRNTNPAAMRNLIVNSSTQNKLSNIPPGTPNRLVFNNYQQ